MAAVISKMNGMWPGKVQGGKKEWAMWHTIVYYIAEMHMFVHVVFCCFGKLWGIQVSKHPFNTCGVQTHCFVMDNCGCVVLILNS